jgi:drug/metabolite transporter (DMT)-like permease
LLLAVVLTLGAASGFAVGSILIRIGTQRVSAPIATFFTVFTGSILVCSIAFAFDFSEIKSLPFTALGWIALMGFMAYPLARVLHNSAISMVGTTRTLPMTSLQPVIAFTLGVLLLGERPNLLVTVGTPIIVVGLLLVVFPRPSASSVERVVNVRNLGYLLAIGGSIAFASRDVVSRHVVTGIAPPFMTAGFALVIGGLILFAFTHRGVVNTVRTVPPRYIAICALAGLIQGMAVATLFQALSRAPVTVVSPIFASQPLIALLLAWLFLRRLEVVDVVLVMGTLLSVGGVVLVILGATN